MKKTKQILGLPVMGMKEGKTRGIATDFLIDADAKRIRYILLNNERNAQTRVLAIEDVKGIGANYIMTESIENAKGLFECPDVCQEMETTALYGNELLSARVLSVVGNILPEVREFVFDEKTGNIETLILANGQEHPASIIATLARDIVFLDIADQPEETFFEPEAEVEEPKEAEEEPAKEEEVVIQSAYAMAQREFLLGHVVNFDITDAAGNVIIPQGTVVTDAVIALAERNDVSADLALNVD